MSVETVKTYLKSFGRDEDVQEFPVSSATVELAAAALSVEPARIAKTLSFADGDGCLLGVTCEELEAYSRDAVWVDVCKDRAPA